MTDDLFDVKNLAWFWRIIASASADRGRLAEILKQFSREEISRFQDTFLELAVELQGETFGDQVNESEDGLEDLSYCVVGAGESSYAAVLVDPGLIKSYVDSGSAVNLDSVAYEVYFRRFGEPLEIM